MIYNNSICFEINVEFKNYINKISSYINLTTEEYQKECIKYHISLIRKHGICFKINSYYIKQCIVRKDNVIDESITNCFTILKHSIDIIGSISDLGNDEDNIYIKDANNRRTILIFMYDFLTISESIFLAPYNAIEDYKQSFNNKLKKQSSELIEQINKIEESKNVLEEQYQDLSENTSENLQKVQKIENRLRKERKILKKVRNEVISIISIFVAIAFVMFGGMSMMSSLFSNLSKQFIPLIELSCLGSLLGIIMLSSIYAFIIFILRILGKIKMDERKPYQETYRNLMILLNVIFWIMFVLWLMKTYL